MNPDSSDKTWLRIPLALFGVFLSAQAAWILLAESHRLNYTKLPFDRKTATMALTEQDKISYAASLAVVRGDLWAESAFTYGSELWIDRAMELNAGDELNMEARTTFQLEPCDIHRTVETSGSCSRPWQINATGRDISRACCSRCPITRHRMNLPCFHCV